MMQGGHVMIPSRRAPPAPATKSALGSAESRDDDTIPKPPLFHPMIPRLRIFAPSLFQALLLTLSVQGAGQVPARAGLQQLEDKFGPAAVRRIVEMTGTAGDPQPQEWRVTAPAPGRGDLLREFWIGDQRVTDEGLSDDFYPDRLPKGFLALERVKLDSTQAFAMTEQVARDAGIGFDVINYKLHCREYSDEPVWTLTLLDREDTIVGSVHLSADSGKILRSVWMRRQPNGRLAVEDSARGDRPAARALVPRVGPGTHFRHGHTSRLRHERVENMPRL